MNEALIQAITVHLVMFSDYLESPETKYLCGYSAIGLISIIIILNMGFVIYHGGIRVSLLIIKFWNRYLKKHWDQLKFNIKKDLEVPEPIEPIEPPPP
jgi:muramoyltetrapeptide carboxypeptidase LdcA involved in peptidoglycan recycling